MVIAVLKENVLRKWK